MPKLKKPTKAKVPLATKKKRHKWTKQKYPGLNFNYQVANRKEYLDFDYVDKLDEESKKFLNDFIRGYYITSFSDDNQVKFTKEQKTDQYRNNNSRNRDLYALAKTTNKLDLTDTPISPKRESDGSSEDEMLTRIALKRAIKKVKAEQ